jgi:hypothetical protein
MQTTTMTHRAPQGWRTPLPAALDSPRTLVLAFGARTVASGCQSGWMDFGPERRVTRSAGNVLFELNGKPALDLCKSHLGDLAQGLPGSAPVVSVSCVGRRLVLGERTEEEVGSVLEAAPAGASHVGFYSYGEISPGAAGGASDLHNQTMTVTVFSEA